MPVYCALIAASVAFIAAINVAVTSAGFQASALVRMAADDPIAASAVETDPEFALYEREHYDGIFFYAIARDPLAVGDEHTLIDLPGARYGHPLYGWLAWLLSLGNARFIPAALFVINLVGIGVAGAAASVLAKDLGWSPWAGLVVAFNPGLIYAMTVDTSEILGSCLLILALLAWFRERWILATLALVSLCLAKEPYLLVVAALGIWEIVKVLRGRRAADLRRRILILSGGPVAVLLWQLHLRINFGYWAFQDDLHVFTFPFSGWADTLSVASFFGRAGDFEAIQVAASSTPLLLALGGTMVAAAVFAARLRTPIDLIVIGMIAMNFCLTWRNLYFAKDLIRQMSTVVLLLPVAFASARPGSLIDNRTRVGEPLRRE